MKILCGVAAGACLAALSACDPCSGIVGCNDAPHVAAAGRIVIEASGAPAANIPIDFVRTGGVGVERDSMRTTTDAEGQFEFSVRANDTGTVVAFIRVAPPDRNPFRVVGLRFRTTTRRGEGVVFQPWTTQPTFPDFAQIVIRGAPTIPAASVNVEFQRTGGVDAGGLPAGLFARQTDGNGMMPLFGLQAVPFDVGDVIGDLTVFMPPPIGTIVRKDLHVPANVFYHPGIPQRRVGVGPSLEYHIQVNRRGRQETLKGVQISFVQTGGIQVNPPTWTSTTDENGRIALPVRPRSLGTLIGDLTVTPPAPWKSFVRKGLVFTAFEEDEARLYAVLEVGPGVGAFAVVMANGTPLRNARVDFRRTGGVALSSGVLSAFSNDSGYAYFSNPTDVEGDIIGDVTIQPPPPYSSRVVRGVTIRAFDGDAPTPPIILGTWDVAKP